MDRTASVPLPRDVKRAIKTRNMGALMQLLEVYRVKPGKLADHIFKRLHWAILALKKTREEIPKVKKALQDIQQGLLGQIAHFEQEIADRPALLASIEKEVEEEKLLAKELRASSPGDLNKTKKQMENSLNSISALKDAIALRKSRLKFILEDAVLPKMEFLANKAFTKAYCHMCKGFKRLQAQVAELETLANS